MSENRKNFFNKIYTEVKQGNALVIAILIIFTIWGYSNIWAPFKEKTAVLLSIGLGNANYTSIVEADVRALREEIKRLKNSLESQRHNAELGKEFNLVIKR